MKNVTLSNVNLGEFSKFIGTLASLSKGKSVYFVIDNDSVYSDSYIESKTLIKSLRYALADFCENESIDDTIKFTFFSGKKIKDALSYLNGDNLSIEVSYDEYDGENYCSTVTLTDGLLNITLNGANPGLVEFANVPKEVIGDLTSVESANSQFRITTSELTQIKSLLKLDTNEHITFVVESDSVYVKSDGSFNRAIEGTNLEVTTTGEYPISKELIPLLENDIYDVYPLDDQLIMKSIDGKNVNVISLVDLVD